MNRNTIISLSMLYALWQTERKDLLDLIRPFVMYAVGRTKRKRTPYGVRLLFGET